MARARKARRGAPFGNTRPRGPGRPAETTGKGPVAGAFTPPRRSTTGAGKPSGGSGVLREGLGAGPSVTGNMPGKAPLIARVITPFA